MPDEFLIRDWITANATERPILLGGSLRRVPTITRRELSEMLGANSDTIWIWQRKKWIPRPAHRDLTKVGGRLPYAWTVDEVEAVLRAHPDVYVRAQACAAYALEAAA